MPNDHFTNEQIEDRIKRHIAEARFDASEKRNSLILTFFGIVIVIFGAILPYVLTTRAIDEMKENFEKLASTQLRKPDIECFLGGNKLDGQTLTFASDKREVYDVILKNTGDAKAENIKMRMFFSKEREILGVINVDYPWVELTYEVPGTSPNPDYIQYSDEPGFFVALGYIFSDGTNQSQRLSSLDATEEFPFRISNLNFQAYKNKPIQALLKIYYGEPNPKRIPFNILISQ